MTEEMRQPTLASVQLFVCDGRFRKAPEGFVNFPGYTPPLPYHEAVLAADALNRTRPDDIFWVRPEPVSSR